MLGGEYSGAYVDSASAPERPAGGRIGRTDWSANGTAATTPDTSERLRHGRPRLGGNTPYDAVSWSRVSAI